MNNIFAYSDNNKRYYTYDYYNRQRYGKRMFRLPISLNLTCPNRDGSKGYGGCAYCSEKGSGNGLNNLSVSEQIERERIILAEKGRAGGNIAYFQAYTNTYGNPDYLRDSFNEALSMGVDGIIIATRPDVLPDNIMDILSDLNKRTELSVELGLQSVKDSTNELLNRHITFAEFLEGYRKLEECKIRTGIHIINSLPYEDYDDMMNTARVVADLHPCFLKIHMLHILKGTRLHRMYLEQGFRLLTREEYISLVCDQLEILPPDIVIERLTGDGERGLVAAPMWATDKLKNLNGIDKELKKRESYQGRLYNK